ncbi:MAG: hypothetical protein HY443_01890 [Candidatus Nealsonbacteria bacterium]|nr:hypothetical protein [Candidatus Nealsonbacteria bacterium]
MLDKRKKYLQIALNSTLEDARLIIEQLPLDERILIEVGTPLIKTYGQDAIRKINYWWTQKIFGLAPEADSQPSSLLGIIVKSYLKSQSRKKKEGTREGEVSPYVVADLKCMDRGATEADIAHRSGANAAVILGQAPIETLDSFIEECAKLKLDSMVDMMNVGYPLEVLHQLKNPPEVVILHRGVDEEILDPEAEIPFHEIHRIKEDYDVMVAVAGGDTFQEVQRAVFNDADIVVVWKSFYQSASDTAKLAAEFLRDIR